MDGSDRQREGVPAPFQLSDVAATLDHLPLNRWHIKCLAAVGMAHLFDAFDLLSVAFALPLIIVQWHLSIADASLIIAITAVGQLIGALVFGAVASRIGHIRTLAFALVLLAACSLGVAFAPNLAILLLFRFCQGVGLGGETPVAAAYIAEISPVRIRGRLTYALQIMFGLGLVAAAISSALIIPQFGWRAMFVVGAAPLILGGLFLTAILPESPKWLVSQGRDAEALAIVRRAAGVLSPAPRIDRETIVVRLPARAGRIGMLLDQTHVVRSLTLWTIAFCASVAGYGIINWMPTIYATVLHLPVRSAFRYSIATTVVTAAGSVFALGLIDLIGRRWTFVLSFGVAAAVLVMLAALVDRSSILAIVVMTTAGAVMLSFVLGGVYVYAPELYPIGLRGIGSGTASAWLRAGTIIGPLCVGRVLPTFGIQGALFFFGAVALAGAAVTLLFARETSGTSLDLVPDQISE